jgi:Zn-finger nucleic acid-binding protein
MQCPVCKDIALVMNERQSIEIDYCPQCRGVWLDRGELDKIIERSQQQDAGRLPQVGYNRHGERQAHHGEQRGHHGQQHGRKSFWKEIFD